MTTHILKCHAEYFDAVVSGEKTFEVRKDDRGFEVGDALQLVRVNESGSALMPRQEVVKHVAYILDGGKFGVQEGYVVLGFAQSDTLDGFDDDAIEAEYEKRFSIPDNDAIPRIYDLLAQGEVDLAMEQMASAFDLPPPHHARRVAARVAAGRQGELHV